MGKEFVPVPPPEAAVARRKWFSESRLVEALLPLRIHDTHDGLPKAAEAVKNSHGVNIVFAPHPGLRDSLDMGRLIGGSETLRAQPVLAPIAKHQYDKTYIRLLARLFAVELRPVITQRTMERHPGQYDRRQAVEYLGVFTGDMAKTLDAGGVVFETIYADRQVLLTPPLQRPVQLAVKKASEQGVDDFGLLVAYLQVPDAGTEIKNLAFGQAYKAWVGDYYPVQEAIDRAGGIQNLDSWTYGKILELAHEAEEYRDSS